MDRRDFLRRLGVTPIAGFPASAERPDLATIRATKLYFQTATSPLTDGQTDFVEGKWRLEVRNGRLVIQCFAPAPLFYFEIGIGNLAADIDWVQCQTLRKHEHPMYAKVTEMFGFGENHG